MARRRPIPVALALLACACGDDGTGAASTSTAATGDPGPVDTSADDGSGGGASSGTVPDTTSEGTGPAADSGAEEETTAASATDGGTTGEPESPCPGLLCDDFEAGALDRTLWTRLETSDGNTIEVQSDVVAHGDYAVRFHAQGGTNLAMMFLEALPAELGQHYFGRLSFRITDFPFENGGHTAYVTSSADLRGFPWADHHFEVGSYYGGPTPIWQLTYWTGDGPEYIGSGGQIPQDQWFCLQWEFNDEPDQIVVLVDGSEDLGAAFTDIQGASDLLGEMNTLGLGFRTFHPMGAPDLDVYVDDLVLDSAPIDCP